MKKNKSITKSFDELVERKIQSNIMTPEIYIQEFEKILNDMLDITKKKNHDYSGTKDAFQNFKLIANLTDNRISVADGIIVRMTDKIQRISNLLQSEAMVSDEKITDTLQDLSIYSIILIIWLKNNIKLDINKKL